MASASASFGWLKSFATFSYAKNVKALPFTLMMVCLLSVVAVCAFKTDGPVQFAQCVQTTTEAMSAAWEEANDAAD